MSKVRLVVELDDQDPYDRAVVQILSKVSEAERKNLLVSGLLYWTRSPAIQLTDKIDQLLSVLSTSGGTTRFHLTHHRPTTQPSQTAPVKTQEGPPQEILAPVTPASFDDGADDAFESLFKNSVSS